MMIRALLRKQLRELGAAFLRSSKTGKARSRASAVGYALLFAVLVVMLMLCFAGMALPLASVLLPAGLDWLYFASMGLTALLVSVLASAFTSYSGLFQSRDNELLLSLPIPPAVIFGVRVSTVYLACLIYLFMAWVPAVVCYGLLAARPLAGVLCSIPMALVLAGAACILAVLLGWAVALANDRARHKSLVTVVCSLVFFALYYAGFLRVQEMLDDLLADAAQSGAALARAAWPLRLLGGAAAGKLPALVGLVLGTALCFAVFCKLLEKPYLRRMTARKGTARTAYHARKARPVSLRQALLRRELLHLGSSPAYMLNSAMGTLGLLVLGGVSLWKADLFARFAQAVPEGVPVLVCCAVCAVSAVNFLTTPSVSLEGRTVWLLQSLPIPSWQALCAKLELHLLLTGGIVPCVYAGGGADADGVFLPDPAGSRAVRAAQCGNGPCTGACAAQPALDERGCGDQNEWLYLAVHGGQSRCCAGADPCADQSADDSSASGGHGGGPCAAGGCGRAAGALAENQRSQTPCRTFLKNHKTKKRPALPKGGEQAAAVCAGGAYWMPVTL